VNAPAANGLPVAGTRRSKILAFGLLLLAFGATVRFVAVPVVQRYLSNVESLEEQRYQLRRFELVAAQLEVRQTELARVLRTNEIAVYALKHTSPALAAAELQETVKGLVVTNGGELTSVRVLPTKVDGKFERVSVNVRATLENEGLQNVLYALESATPYLQVENLSVSSRNRGRSASRRVRRSSQAASAVPTELEVTFDLAGLLASRGQ
jgi:general secretion pathway protein M